MASERAVRFDYIGRDVSASRTADKIGRKFDDLGGKFKTFAKVAGATALAGVAGVGAGLFKIESAWGDATDQIIVGTGKTGKALDGLIDDFRAVGSRVPSSLDDVGAAIADLNTRTGQSGKPLQELAERFLDLSRLTKTDVKTNIKTVTRLFGDWSVATEDQADTLDKLFKASQSTGIGVDRLSELMVQFGSPLRQLGLDFDFTAAMFARFEQEGVNIETAMPGLRMALKNFAKDGREPAEALAETIEAIKNAASTADANTLAFQTFGVRAGPDLAAAIREGRFDLDDLIETLGDSEGALEDAARGTEGFKEAWNRVKNKVFIGLGPLATRFFDGLGDGLDTVSGKLGPFVDTIATKLGGIDWKGITDDARDRLEGIFDDLDLKNATKTLTREATKWAGGIITGIKTGVTEGDWSGLGGALADGIVRAASIGRDLTIAFTKLIARIDWFEVGKSIGKQAGSFALGFVSTLIEGIIDAFTKRPLESTLALVMVVPIGRVAGMMGKAVAKIPFLRIFAPLFDGIAGLGKLVEKAAGPVLRGVGSFVAALGRGFLTGFRTVFPGIGSNLARWLSNLPTAIGVAAINIRQAAGRMVGRLADGILSGAGKIGSTIGTIIGKIVQPFAGAAGWLVTRGRQVVGGLSSGLGGMFGILGARISSVIGKITAPFRNAGSWLWNAGKRIIEGLIGGIGSMFSSVKRKLGQLAGLIPGWKGPEAADKRLLRKPGQWIVEGLVGGLESRFGAVERSVSSLTAAIPVAAASAAGSTRVPMSAAPITINIYESRDPRATALEVNRQLLRLKASGFRLGLAD